MRGAHFRNMLLRKEPVEMVRSIQSKVAWEGLPLWCPGWLWFWGSLL